MALHSRLDDPVVVLLGAALLVAIPGLTLQVGGAVGTLLAAGAALLGSGLLAWKFRLASPVAVSVGLVALEAGIPSDLSPLAVVVLPVVAAVAALEYAVRRAVGRASVRFSRDSEVALLAGTVAGVAWAAVVHLALPATQNFGVVRDTAPDGSVVSLAYLVYAVAGPVLLVGLAVALLARFRLVTPLAFAGLEVGSFLAKPGGGDSVGSLASLLWFLGVPLLLAVAAVELWLRTEGLPRARARFGIT